MLNWFGFNRAQFNQAVAAASSINTGATRSPFGHIMVAIPDGDLLLIYQQGTNGLCYRVSTNGGTVWGAENVIDADTTVYASAIVNPTTKDVHVVYSKHGDPTINDEPIYYRPLIWDSGDEDWNVGGEQQLAGGGSLYDPAVAGRRNATISIGDDNFPVVTYLRNEYNTTSWAMLVSQEAWALTDFSVDLDIGVAADEDSRGAAVQTDDRSVYFVSRTGSWYSLAFATIANPMAATGVDMTVLFSWLGSESAMVAVARNDDGDRLGIVYLAGDGAPHFRLYSIDATSKYLISDTEMDATAVESVSITWDGTVFWLAWLESDNVRVSNSDAPATVVQTFANPDPAAGYYWSWLNSPVSCLYAQRVVFTWCDTLATTFVGTFLADRAVAEDETVVGVGEAEIGVSEDEVGAGADVVTAFEVIDVPDAGTGADAFALGIPIAETGAGVVTAGKSVVVDETGEGTDSRQLAMAGGETGTGADSVDIIVNIPVADAGTGVDAEALGIAVADAGAGVTAREVGPWFAETGEGADAAIIAVERVDEAGAGAEALIATMPMTDSGVGVDATLAEKPGADEEGIGEDEVEIAVAVAEAGSGADVIGAGDAIFVNVPDTGTGVDSPSMIWIPTAVVIRLLASSGEVRLKTES